MHHIPMYILLAWAYISIMLYPFDEYMKYFYLTVIIKYHEIRK